MAIECARFFCFSNLARDSIAPLRKCPRRDIRNVIGIFSTFIEVGCQQATRNRIRQRLKVFLQQTNEDQDLLTRIAAQLLGTDHGSFEVREVTLGIALDQCPAEISFAFEVIKEGPFCEPCAFDDLVDGSRGKAVLVNQRLGRIDDPFASLRTRSGHDSPPGVQQTKSSKLRLLSSQRKFLGKILNLLNIRTFIRLDGLREIFILYQLVGIFRAQRIRRDIRREAQMIPGNRKRISAGDQPIGTVVVGGSQAGLAVSYYLTQANRAHIVLEQDRIGSSWTSKRWDSFTLVTPNWMNQLPGHPYNGPDPDGFLSRSEIVAYLEQYASSFDAPIRLGAKAMHLSCQPDGPGYILETNQDVLAARNVIIATGFFHKPKVPDFAESISPSVEQIPSSAYKNPGCLRSGAVLVVGSAQSGCQIAEELHEAGREVYLCVSRAPREPRRYRGKDINYWFNELGGFDKTFKDRSDPVERYRANPHCSGKNGGQCHQLEGLRGQRHQAVGASGGRQRIQVDPRA